MSGSPYRYLDDHRPARILQKLTPEIHHMKQWDIVPGEPGNELWVPEHFVLGIASIPDSPWRNNMRFMCKKLSSKPEEIVRNTWFNMFQELYPANSLVSVFTETDFVTLLSTPTRKLEFYEHPITKTQSGLSLDPASSRRRGYSKSDITGYTIDTSNLDDDDTIEYRAVFYWEVKLDETELKKLLLQGVWKLGLSRSLTGARFAGIACGHLFRRMAIDAAGRLRIDTATDIFGGETDITLAEFIERGDWRHGQYNWHITQKGKMGASKMNGNKVFYDYCGTIGKSVMAEHKNPSSNFMKGDISFACLDEKALTFPSAKRAAEIDAALEKEPKKAKPNHFPRSDEDDREFTGGSGKHSKSTSASHDDRDPRTIVSPSTLSETSRATCEREPTLLDSTTPLDSDDNDIINSDGDNINSDEEEVLDEDDVKLLDLLKNVRIFPWDDAAFVVD